VVAVDLRRRRDENPLAEPSAVVEHVLRPVEVGDDRVDRLLDDQPGTDRGGEVIDHVNLVHQLVHDRVREHRIDDEVELGAVLQVRDVVHGPRREVVERVDLPAVVQQELGEVRADEAGAAR